MILPTKGLGADAALLAIGGQVLRCLDEPKTVSRTWDELKRKRVQPISFDWFVLALDLLFALGTVSLESGRLVRTDSEARS